MAQNINDGKIKICRVWLEKVLSTLDDKHFALFFQCCINKALGFTEEIENILYDTESLALWKATEFVKMKDGSSVIDFKS